MIGTNAMFHAEVQRGLIQEAVVRGIGGLKGKDTPVPTNGSGVSLDEYGIDSLGLVELTLFIEDALKIKSIGYTDETLISGDDTVASVVNKIEKLIKGDTNDKTT